MEQSTVVVQESVVDTSNGPVVATPPHVSLEPTDFKSEIAKIAAEQGLIINAEGDAVPKDTPPTPAPQASAQPVPPLAAEQPPVQVPEKFQAPDGTADLAKIEKSTLSAEAAIAKYREKETELRKLQNAVNQAPQAPQVTQPQVPQQAFSLPELAGITPQMVEEEIKANGAGVAVMKMVAIATQAAKQAALNETKSEVAQLRDTIESRQRVEQLQEIAKTDPWVYTEEGMNKLFEIRAAKPYLNAAPNPMDAAYREHLADQALKQRTQGTVNMPTPTAGTAKAPPTPVSAPPRSNSQDQLLQLANDPKRLNAYLDTLQPKAQEALWDKLFPNRKK